MESDRGGRLGARSRLIGALLLSLAHAQREQIESETDSDSYFRVLADTSFCQGFVAVGLAGGVIACHAPRRVRATGYGLCICAAGSRRSLGGLLRALDEA
jgi:hypothetical protein